MIECINCRKVMKFRCTGLSDVGLVRSTNQDAYYIDPQGRFFIVADGMGGHAGGEEASRIATQVIQAYLVERWDAVTPTPTLLECAFLQANSAIIQDQQKHPQRADMGTTVVAVIFRQQACYAHIGDSRLYRLRVQLQQITQDHTWVARALQFGDLTPQAAQIHPYRHILLQCLGREDVELIDVEALDVQAGDRLLLCSDGLTQELSAQQIASHLQYPDIDKAVFALVEAAKANGGHDNITAVVVAID